MTTLSSWNTNRAGGGSSPSSFSSSDTYTVQDMQTALADSTWTATTGPSTITIESGGTMNSNTFNPVVTLSMQSTATYIMSSSSYSALTLGTINSASTFDYRATTTAFRSLAYGSFIWNYTAGSDTPGPVTTTGTFTNNTGGSRELRVATATTARTWTIGTDMANNASSVWNLNNGTGNGTAINIGGGLTNAGTINKAGAGTTSLNFNGTGSSNVTWGTVTNTNFSSLSITIGANKTITFLDSLNEGAAAFSVSGTLNIGTNVLSGTAGTFSLASGATLITSNATGLDGSITVTGTKTFSTGANYEFRGAATGATLPSTVNNLTINPASGNVDLNGAGTTQTVSNTLNVFSGNLNANGTRTTISVAGTGDAVVVRGGAQINSNAIINLTGASGGNVVFDAVNNGTATIAGNLGLGGATRTFNIGDGTAATDMLVSGTISNGGVLKSGNGTLVLSNGSNSYSAGTTVSAGTLQMSGSGTLGSTSGALTVNAGTFDLNGTNQTVGSLSGSGGTITNTLTANNPRLTIGQGDATGGNYQGTITNVAGTVGLTKVGTGTQTLSGSAANTYTGTTLINDGELDLNKSANTQAISSFVTVGDNVGAANSATLKLLANNQAGPGSTVTINSDGVFNMQNFNETLSSLELFGGNVTGTGTLTASAFTMRAGTATANLTGTGAPLTKTTAGTVTLTGNNTYTGATTVSAGTLLVSNSAGSGTGSGNVTVNGTGTVLGGTGIISGTVTLGNSTPGAILNPGPSGTNASAASVGTLTTGAVTLTGTNTVHIDAFGTATNQWDKLVSTGAIMLDPSSILDVTIASGLGFTQGATYVLLTSTGLSGTFSGIVDGQTYSFSGYDFTASYTPTDFDLIAVPEPSTWAAAALAAAVIGYQLMRRRRRIVLS